MSYFTLSENKTNIRISSTAIMISTSRVKEEISTGLAEYTCLNVSYAQVNSKGYASVFKEIKNVHCTSFCLKTKSLVGL